MARTTDMTQHPHLCCEQLLTEWVGGSKDRNGDGNGDGNWDGDGDRNRDMMGTVTGTTNTDTTMARQLKTMRTSSNHHSEQLLAG
jgi:hypothetical protein